MASCCEPGTHQAEVMSYHGRDHIPFIDALAREFTVCDRWFSSVMGPTWPNRFYLHAATADGHKTNLPMGLSPPPTIWERIADRCWTAKNYYSSRLPWYSLAFPAKSFSGDDAVTPRRWTTSSRDAAAASLPTRRSSTRLRGERRPSAPRPRAVRGVRGERLPGDGGEPQLVTLAARRQLRRARRLLRSRGPPETDDPNPEFRQLAPRAGDRRRADCTPGAVVSTPFEQRVDRGDVEDASDRQPGRRMDAANDLSSCLDPEAVIAGARRCRRSRSASRARCVRRCASTQSSRDARWLTSTVSPTGTSTSLRREGRSWLRRPRSWSPCG